MVTIIEYPVRNINIKSCSNVCNIFKLFLNPYKSKKKNIHSVKNLYEQHTILIYYDHL